MESKDDIALADNYRNLDEQLELEREAVQREAGDRLAIKVGEKGHVPYSSEERRALVAIWRPQGLLPYPPAPSLPPPPPPPPLKTDIDLDKSFLNPTNRWAKYEDRFMSHIHPGDGEVEMTGAETWAGPPRNNLGGGKRKSRRTKKRKSRRTKKRKSRRNKKRKSRRNKKRKSRRNKRGRK